MRAQVFDARTDAHGLNVLSLPEDDLATLREGFRQGGAAVYAEVPDARVDAVANALEASGAVDLDEREAEWRRAGWAGPSIQGTSGASVAPAATGAVRGTAEAGGVEHLGPAPSEERIPLVEETLRIGKREVEHGRVRVRSYVVETPVSEQVMLREEHVDVSRRSVDRPLTDVDDAFRERIIDATEHAEEAVVSKEARVREEVVVRKDADQRTETVQDTVRRTEVEVENGRSATAAVDTTGTNIGGANRKV